MSSTNLEKPLVRRADLDQACDQQAILGLLDHYARHPMGQSTPLTPSVANRLIDGLRSHPTTVVFLAEFSERPLGLAICFVGYSTFEARRLINVHDLVVHASVRGRGIGSSLLDEVIRYAQSQHFCGVTLEVRGDNPARVLYSKKGFRGLAIETLSDATFFGKRSLP